MEQAPGACVQSHLKVVLNSEARTTTVSWEDKADTPVCLCLSVVVLLFESKTIEDSNLVDSARSHTLVSKIKPCMSKYKNFLHLKLRTAHYISYSLFDNPLLLGYL